LRIISPLCVSDATVDPYLYAIAPTPRGFTLYSLQQESYPTVEDGLAAFIQAYRACITFVDREIGKVLAALETNHFASSTVVAVTSDHGWQDGPKHYVFKNATWDDSSQVPLIIRAPGVTVVGSRVKQPVSLIDLYPTLVDLCNLQGDTRRDPMIGRPLDGHSLRPMLQDPDHGNQRWNGTSGAISAICYGSACKADGMYAAWTVRTEQWRYILYPTGDEELYNHTAHNDPHKW
jgi:arylsulfatase A-like enzyme